LHLDRALQANIRHSHRNPERVGSFTLKLNPSSCNPYLNYAVPDDDVDPTSEEIAQLVEAFRDRKRRPRLEYIGNAAPQLEAALILAGFSMENRLPVLVCTADALRSIDPPLGIEFVTPSTDEEFAGLIEVTKEAYTSVASEATTDEIQGRRTFVDSGGIAVLACDASSGDPAGSGICEVPVSGVSELATVGVRPAFEGRGIATALAARLASDAFAAGVELLWLAPMHGGAERIYRRVGFEPASETLHISRE
jgi:GNAT superfamily N-acetyltransferase